MLLYNMLLASLAQKQDDRGRGDEDLDQKPTTPNKPAETADLDPVGVEAYPRTDH